jgi:hypothetical protein
VTRFPRINHPNSARATLAASRGHKQPLWQLFVAKKTNNVHSVN